MPRAERYCIASRRLVRLTPNLSVSSISLGSVALSANVPETISSMRDWSNASRTLRLPRWAIGVPCSVSI